MLRFLVGLFACSVVGLGGAEPSFFDTKDMPYDAPKRVGAYGDNYILVHQMQNNQWAERDELALRGQYSFRYVFKGTDTYQVLASYTNEFDFYMGSRPSSPVVNRLSNPALHVRFAAKPLFSSAGNNDYLEVGLEHCSDGQVVEVKSGSEAQAAQTAYTNRDRRYFDQISRGSNFVSFKAKFVEEEDGLPFSVFAKARLYFSKHSEVTWGPLAGQDRSIADYDIISLRLGKNTRLGLFEAQWTMGKLGLKTDSFGFGWQAPDNLFSHSVSIPLFLRVHRGPMNTLSNYTQRQDSVGIGLRFASF